MPSLYRLGNCLKRVVQVLDWTMIEFYRDSLWFSSYASLLLVLSSESALAPHEYVQNCVDMKNRLA